MTAKEKAKELFYFTQKKMLDSGMAVSKQNVKDMCILILDNIDAALTEHAKDMPELQNMESEFRFYEEVEEEIRNMNS